MRRRIEEYFEYFWERDLNFAMKSEDDQRFISELPKEIRINVSSHPVYYLVLSFYRFIRTFCFPSFCTSSEPTSKSSDKIPHNI
jgi:hypothetical protein